jgi:hypothetical protein
MIIGTNRTLPTSFRFQIHAGMQLPIPWHEEFYQRSIKANEADVGFTL